MRILERDETGISWAKEVQKDVGVQAASDPETAQDEVVPRGVVRRNLTEPLRDLERRNEVRLL